MRTCGLAWLAVTVAAVTLGPEPLAAANPAPRPEVSASGDQFAGPLRCNAEGAWRRVRAAYPMHAQILATCENREAKQQVVVLTEPPPHVARNKAAEVVKALFAVPVKVETRRQKLGYNGWAEDLVIIANSASAAELKGLAEDLARLCLYLYGSSYKAEVQDIASLRPTPLWEAPPALEVTAGELQAWLLGPSAKALIAGEGGAPTTLKALNDGASTGIFQTIEPGLVVAILPASASHYLDDHVATLRRFAVDSDVFLGAIKLKERVALIGRERGTSLTAAPPLRVETILLLAARRSDQLQQSYERTRPFAGKLLTGAGDLFGWDWAPILLSDELIDTEFGSLLNFTDNMLKSWSESGNVEYMGWPHPRPKEFPFREAGAAKTLGTERLTFNWNTAGVGYLSEWDGFEIFAIRNTGSLPVSYFPEGSQQNAAAKAKLADAEDKAYAYFSSRGSPMLQRAVQYTGLYQAFQAFAVLAKPRDMEMAASNARMTRVEEILQKRARSALELLARADTPSTDDLRLGAIYHEYGEVPKKKDLQLEPGVVARKRREIASEIAALDAQVPGWRQLFIKSLAASGGPRWVTAEELAQIQAERRQVRAIEARLDKVTQTGWRLALPLDHVRREVVEATEHEPRGWIRTPSIVVSRYVVRGPIGGHNIGGRATRVETDLSLQRGRVEVSGNYGEGRVIRVHPKDAADARALVRIFDREVGLNDTPEMVANGVSALRARLSQPSTPQPPRADMRVALGLGPARSTRGAEASPRATPLGYVERASASPDGKWLEALRQQAKAHIAVMRTDAGFEVRSALLRTDATIVAPTSASLIDALILQRRAIAKTLPAGAEVKYLGVDISGGDLTHMVTTVNHHLKAADSVGGKPPIDGGRGHAAASDGFYRGNEFNLPVVAWVEERGARPLATRPRDNEARAAAAEPKEKPASNPQPNARVSAPEKQPAPKTQAASPRIEKDVTKDAAKAPESRRGGEAEPTREASASNIINSKKADKDAAPAARGEGELVYKSDPVTEQALSIVPDWSAAKVNVRLHGPNEVRFTQAAEMADGFVFSTEVTLRVASASSTSKSLVLNTLAKFLKKPEVAVFERLKGAATQTFTGLSRRDLRAALTSFKRTLLKEGAKGIKFLMRYEGRDLIISDREFRRLMFANG